MQGVKTSNSAIDNIDETGLQCLNVTAISNTVRDKIKLDKPESNCWNVTGIPTSSCDLEDSVDVTEYKYMNVTAVPSSESDKTKLNYSNARAISILADKGDKTESNYFVTANSISKSEMNWKDLELKWT